VIQPGGSVKDEDVIKAADEHGIAMIFTKMRTSGIVPAAAVPGQRTG